MKSDTAFTSLATLLLDRWVQTSPDNPIEPKDLYAGLQDRLTPKMRMTVVSTVEESPSDWIMTTIRQMRLPTQLLNFAEIFSHGRLSDIGDQAFVSAVVVPAYLDVLNTRKPKIDAVKSQLLGVSIGYDRILLPQRNRNRSEWVLALANCRFMVRRAPDDQKPSMEDQTLLHLLSEGMSAREIATALEASPRTIEHRIERLKIRFGARNIANLTAIATAQALLEFTS